MMENLTQRCRPVILKPIFPTARIAKPIPTLSNIQLRIRTISNRNMAKIYNQLYILHQEVCERIAAHRTIKATEVICYFIAPSMPQVRKLSKLKDAQVFRNTIET